MRGEALRVPGEEVQEGEVPDLSPPGAVECPLVDEGEKRRHEAVTASWAGIIVAIVGVLSWSTYGFTVCGLGALVAGLYARGHAPAEANGPLAASVLLLALLALRLAGVL